MFYRASTSSPGRGIDKSRQHSEENGTSSACRLQHADCLYIYCTRWVEAGFIEGGRCLESYKYCILHALAQTEVFTPHLNRAAGDLDNELGQFGSRWGMTTPIFLAFERSAIQYIQHTRSTVPYYGNTVRIEVRGKVRAGVIRLLKLSISPGGYSPYVQALLSSSQVGIITNVESYLPSLQTTTSKGRVAALSTDFANAPVPFETHA